jgi:hypothetical protein
MKQNRTATTRENHMNQTPRPKDPATARPLLDEADIGSGEKTPGQQETEEFIRQIPPLPPAEPRDEVAPKPGPTH